MNDSDFLSIFLSLSLSILSSTESLSLHFHSQGMVYSAEYIKKKLEQEMILSQAFGRDLVHDSVHCIKNVGLSNENFLTFAMCICMNSTVVL